MCPVAHSFLTRHRRAIDVAIVCLFAGYFVYVLMLSKFFVGTVPPDWFRDFGILWDSSDDVFATLHYRIGANYFPPANAVLMHVFGLIGRDLAYRIYLLIQIGSLVVTLWAWARLTGAARRPDCMLIVLAAVLTVIRYVHFEFHMHNVNLVALALVSLALVAERPVWAGLCYALSLAIKPYGSVLLLPWMAWQARWRWTLAALAWLAVFFIVVPALWFGPDAAWRLHDEWIVSTIAGAQSAHDQFLSVRSGIAVVLGAGRADATVVMLDRACTAVYLLALVAFFLPVLWRRGTVTTMVMACEAAAMLLAPLPLGGLQQPARACVLAAATLVMAAAAVDERRARAIRGVLAGLLVAIGIAVVAVPIGPLHFLLTMPVCLAALAGLALVRRTEPAAAGNVGSEVQCADAMFTSPRARGDVDLRAR